MNKRAARKAYIKVYMKGYNKVYRRVHHDELKAKRRQRKRDAIDYKGGKCERCGYCRCIAALQFHHRNPHEKEFQIATMFTWAWVRVMQELDKCDLVCANCHAEEHWKGE